MHFVRQILRDGLSGGVLAGLVAVMLLLQGAIGGFAAASMLSMDGAIETICASGGGAAHQRKDPQDGSQQRPCCQAACQAAASLAPALPCGDTVVAFERIADIGRAALWLAGHEPPRLLGLSGDPRGPPFLS